MNRMFNPRANLLCLNGSGHVPRVHSVAIVAHSDDAEILAPEGLIRSWEQKKPFGVVVVNDGVGRPRALAYESYPDEDMMKLRIGEQFAAARAGGYAFALALSHPSCSTKGKKNELLLAELRSVLELAQPEMVYTHNPWDEHPSHIAVLQHYLWAQAEAKHRPEKLFGGEVWGAIDRIPEPYLVRWDCSGHEQRLEELLRYFASQNAIKAYDRAVMARRQALAKLNNPHVTLQASAIHLGIDLTKILRGELSLREFIELCDETERRTRLDRFLWI